LKWYVKSYLLGECLFDHLYQYAEKCLEKQKYSKLPSWPRECPAPASSKHQKPSGENIAKSGCGCYYLHNRIGPDVISRQAAQAFTGY
jgi:hypothetical protein